ncbi:MAG: type II toxin-antitoxin system RelE/ParE family toxin [Defluviitaleaceae bacterium]|nr:type II toxin-antitoxin system RelE/ParE family toxin [Defluviitaleaceae bacterium]
MAYEVILETTAVHDLYGILDYITNVLKAPESAERVVLSIEEKVMSLSFMPARHPVVNEEPYASMGVRLMPVENYTAFYIIDEAKRKVHVFRILYNRREWQNVLYAR